MHDNKNEKPKFIEWLGFRRKLDFSEARWLGSFCGFFVFSIALILFVAMLMTLAEFLYTVIGIEPYANDDTGEAIRNLGLVLAAFFGAPFIVWRTVVAAKQAEIARISLFNDEINAAAQALTSRREITQIVEENGNEVVLRLWEDDLVTRVTAIDRFEGLVEENNDVAPRIVRLLATYVRGNFPCTNVDFTENFTERSAPRMDIQKAIDAIGRVYRIEAQTDSSQWRLVLKGCNFDGVNFPNGYFRAADFSGCRFEASILRQGNFEGCLFYNSLLNYGDFFQTNLRGARLDRVTLNRPQPIAGGFVQSINMGDLTGVTFVAANISALDYLGEAKDISQTFGTQDTIISGAIRRKMLESEAHHFAHSLRGASSRRDITEQQQEQVKSLEETGFQHWSPFPSTDGATGWLLEKFFVEMEMKHWPFYG